MNTNKSIFSSQHFLAMEIADIFNPNKRRILNAMRTNKTFFPSPHTIYEKDIVLEQMKKISPERIKTKAFVPPLLKAKNKSRFDFASQASNINEAIEIPSFVSSLISANIFENFVKDDENFVYKNYSEKCLFREYKEQNDWARFIISYNGEQRLKVALEKLDLDEERQLLNKFKSA